MQNTASLTPSETETRNIEDDPLYNRRPGITIWLYVATWLAIVAGVVALFMAAPHDSGMTALSNAQIGVILGGLFCLALAFIGYKTHEIAYRAREGGMRRRGYRS